MWFLPAETKLTPVPEYISILNNRRYKYDDFWRLIAQSQLQPHGCEDEGNAWGMAKLRYLDGEDDRRYYWKHNEVQQIRNEMGESWIET
jgi:hypothetical protein